jgi:hypothetical protein
MNESGNATNELTGRELEALRAAALWYAKFRAADVAGRADERSTAAIVERVSAGR